MLDKASAAKVLSKINHLKPHRGRRNRAALCCRPLRHGSSVQHTTLHQMTGVPTIVESHCAGLPDGVELDATKGRNPSVLHLSRIHQALPA